MTFRLPLAVAAVAALAAVAAGSAFAHAHMSPPVALAKSGQIFSLAVPTEKEDARTVKVVLTVPDGFSIDSFVPAAGWTRQVQSTGSGEDTVIQSVTWTAVKGIEPGTDTACPPRRTRSSSSWPRPTRRRPTRSRSSRPTPTTRSSTGTAPRAPTRRRRRSRP